MKRWRFVVGIVAPFVLTLGLATPAVGQSSTVQTARNLPALLNIRHVTVQGQVIPGGCTFGSLPKLYLAPNQTAIEADQVSVDTATCLSKYVIGTPVSLSGPARGTGSMTSLADGTPTLANSLHSSSGYTQAYYRDLIGQWVNYDQSNTSWAWDGNCVQAASGSVTYWWLSETGWRAPTNTGDWISTGCGATFDWSQGTFYNYVFCLGTSYTSYSGVNVEGTYNGSLYGWVNGHSYYACLPLFFSYYVVRVT